MAKHCIDCGLKLHMVEDKHLPVRYECAVCNAYWTHTVKVSSTWEKFPIGNVAKEVTNIQAGGFRLKAPSAEDIINQARKTSEPLTADTIRKVADLYMKDMPLDPGTIRKSTSREHMVRSIEATKILQNELITKAKDSDLGAFEESVAEANAKLIKEASEAVVATKLDEIILDHKAYLGHEILGTAGIQGIKDDNR